jgi:hypothetical protein
VFTLLVKVAMSIMSGELRSTPDARALAMVKVSA